MLISCVSPILQVRHARGGQYKYSGRTISFPQQIVQIETYLPHSISDIDILVFKRHGGKGKFYDCYVTKSHVINALLYNMQNEKYYNDVQIDQNLLASLPTTHTNVSSRLHSFSTETFNFLIEELNITNIEHHVVFQENKPMSSLAFIFPNTQREMEKIRAFVDTTHDIPE